MPYNVERLLYLYSEGDAAQVRALMEQFEGSGRAKLPSDIQQKLNRVIKSKSRQLDEEEQMH